MLAPAPTAGSFLSYSLFFLLVLLLIGIDMRVLKQRGAEPVSVRQALLWSGVWVTLALLFGLGLWLGLAQDPGFGPELARQKTLEFFSAYVIEKALAVDNIFVFLLIFSFFAIPAAQQRRVLLYGVLGAIVLRALMVGLGALLVARFSWVLYLFGAFLLFTGWKMLQNPGQRPDGLADNRLLCWLSRYLPLSAARHDQRFFCRERGRWMVTPLFLCLLMIELSDLVFAVDSIPAIFAVTRDPFIVLTSNVLAILGLRALYFLLAQMVARLRWLKHGLALVLCFIGGKMLLEHWLPLPTSWSLLLVLSLLSASVLASLLTERKTSG